MSSPVMHRNVLGRYDYPTSHRALEVVSLAAFVVFGAAFTRDVVRSVSSRWGAGTVVALAFATVTAYALGDLLSGIVHFLFDTFGTPDTRVIGQKFVKPFRDHHVDPMAMTHGDFVAVNADNYFACLPVLVPVQLLLDVDEHPYTGAFLVVLMLATICTNQIHKWAHLPSVPRAVRFAQRHGVILSVAHHQVHHTRPYDNHYCITWGRLDPVLDRVARVVAGRRRAAAS